MSRKLHESSKMWRRLEVWLDVGRISEGAVSRIKIISALALPMYVG